MLEALDIHVTGVVQGVGFRPFVHRAAKQNLISGWVLNAVDGVDIHAEGESSLLDAFVIELSENAPAAAQVREIDLKEVPLQGCEGFEIRFSDDAESRETTLVSPECASCSIPPTAATVILSSIAPTAGRVSPSLINCPTTARPPR